MSVPRILSSKYKFNAGSRTNLIVIKPEKCKINEQKQFLKLGLLNIRSLTPKAVIVNEIITDNSFDVLCLTETWLKTNDYFGLNESTPPSYCYKHEPRETGRGGGVATIYSDILNVTQKTGYRFDSFEILMLNFKLSDKQNKSVLSLALATVYRPPGPYTDFLKEFADFLSDLLNQNLLDYNLQLDGCTVTSSTVKNLGVILDSNLSFENHISNVTKTAFFHLRNISKLRNMLSVSDAEKLVHAFMTSRLDYCNALLGGCPASSINKLQIVQNAAARVLTRSRKYDHITPILQSLHWLPIKFRISYKILLLAYKALNDLAPTYLTNLLSRYNPTRSLRSQNSGLLVVPRIAKSTKGGRTFSYLAPKLWNSLPENVRGSDTLSLFKSRLKTHLFSQAFI